MAQEKKEREALKKNLKVERKKMSTISKEEDYFIRDEKDRVQAMMDIDLLCDGLQLLQLKNLISRVEEARQDKDKARKIIKQEVEDLRSGKLENINISSTNNKGAPANAAGNKSKQSAGDNCKANGTQEKAAWSDEELQLLIKAVNLFPAGTAKR